ncbi:hypothetical protein [Aureibacter tunicatorum]|uniref:Uncharacterized protein n=1 Tax=Aureibacter tunicatorum TaxID=866807 RepID=A0AAE3XPB1_9BACT|nr:hypothetical protein [Aureibacter tunicatorum]MDR6241581.1 hypothetical protein [Aureibacter tunicatorum]BDD07195.1 hypothetical protein AUTU_46780 [Aureibacter tunicatorum]
MLKLSKYDALTCIDKWEKLVGNNRLNILDLIKANHIFFISRETYNELDISDSVLFFAAYLGVKSEVSNEDKLILIYKVLDPDTLLPIETDNYCYSILEPNRGKTTFSFRKIVEDSVVMNEDCSMDRHVSNEEYIKGTLCNIDLSPKDVYTQIKKWNSLKNNWVIKTDSSNIMTRFIIPMKELDREFENTDVNNVKLFFGLKMDEVFDTYFPTMILKAEEFSGLNKIQKSVSLGNDSDKSKSRPVGPPQRKGYKNGQAGDTITPCPPVCTP